MCRGGKRIKLSMPASAQFVNLDILILKGTENINSHFCGTTKLVLIRPFMQRAYNNAFLIYIQTGVNEAPEEHQPSIDMMPTASRG